MSLPPWLQALGISGALTAGTIFFLRNAVKGWVTRQFEKESQEYQHGLDVKLEKIKSSLVKEVVRTSNASEIEYVVLPKIITMMEAAIAATDTFRDSVTRVVYEQDTMPLDLYERWTESLPYDEVDKKSLRGLLGKKRGEAFSELRFRYERRDAKLALRDLIRYLLVNDFVLGELKVTCYGLTNRLSEFINMVEWEKESGNIDNSEWRAIMTIKIAISKQVAERLNFPPTPIPPA